MFGTINRKSNLRTVGTLIHGNGIEMYLMNITEIQCLMALLSHPTGRYNYFCFFSFKCFVVICNGAVTTASGDDFAISVWYHRQEVLTQARNKIVFRLSGQVLTGYKTNHDLFRINSSTLRVFLRHRKTCPLLLVQMI